MRKYWCKTTGEIIKRSCRLSAYRYFKADGKRVGYPVAWKDVARRKVKLTPLQADRKML